MSAGPLAGRAGVVTGAGKGIGAAVAADVAARGAAVVVADFDAEAADAVAAAISAEGGRAVAAHVDVRRFDEVERACQACRSELRGLDFVVANAGIGDYSLMSDGDPERWRTLVETNVLGAAFTVRAALPHMKAQGRGHIVLMASIAGREAWVGEPIYIASKWAVVGLGRTLRLECAPHNVRVTLIEPSMVDTPLVRSTDEGRKELDEFAALDAADVARAVGFALEQPDGVGVSEIVIRAVWTGALTRSRADLATPALVLDLDVLEANIGRMAARFDALPADLRPHVKAHKSSRIARLQCDDGAIGVTAATAAEALAVVAAGVGDVLIANQIVSEPQLDALASAASGARITVAVDDPVHVEAASRAGRRAGAVVGIVIEVDVGMGRAGARSSAEARTLAELAARLPGVDMRGVMGYEGHCTDEPDRGRRTAAVHAAVEILAGAADEIRRASLPCDIVSAGGTGTYDITGACSGVTEVQAGTYAVMDEFHRQVTGEFDSAVTVLATVTSVHGGLVVLDAGRKAIAGDLAAPRMVGREARLEFVHEEHSGFRVDGPRPHVGDRVALIPGYAPLAVNLHAAYHVVRGGTLVDVWPVEARYSSAPTALA